MFTEEQMIGFVWAFTGFDTIFALLRFAGIRGWSNKTTASKFSEVFVFGAWFSTITFTSLITYRQSQIIRFRHSTDPTIVPEEGMPFKVALYTLKASLGELEAYVVILWCVKWSFMCMYYPLLNRLSRRMKVFWYAIIGWTIFTFCIYFCLEFIWCRPARRLWSFTDDYCSSWRSTSGLVVGCLCNVTADMLVMLFPILILRTVTDSRHERAGIFFLCLLGAFVMTSSFVRLGLLIKRNAHPENATAGSLQEAEIWAAVEAFIALWVVCLPSVRRIYAAAKESRANTKNSGRSGGTSEGTFVSRKKQGDTFDSDSTKKLYEWNELNPVHTNGERV